MKSTHLSITVCYFFFFLIFISSSVMSSFLQGDKIECKEEGKIIKFAFLEQDPCILCECRNGTVDCFKNRCEPAYLQMQQEESAPKPNHLKTKKKPENPRQCSHAGTIYKNTETWMESCRRCTCVNGRVNCASPRSSMPWHCPHIRQCPVGYELRQDRTTGCCPRCVPGPKKNPLNAGLANDQQHQVGVCSLDSDRRLVRTFDGREYSLRGRCNYAFVRDCSSTSPAKRAFSVHLVQKFISSRRNHLLLRIRLRDATIYMSHLGRVRVNNKLVKLPHLQFGQYSIVEAKNGEIRFKAMAGLEIRFAANRTLEIKTKDTFRGKVCGLCGNYNADPSDDFRTKRSKELASLERFLHSYKVGKTPFCPKRQRFAGRAKDEKLKESASNKIDSESVQNNKAKRKHPNFARTLFHNQHQQQQEPFLRSETFRRSFPIGML